MLQIIANYDMPGLGGICSTKSQGQACLAPIARSESSWFIQVALQDWTPMAPMVGTATVQGNRQVRLSEPLVHSLLALLKGRHPWVHRVGSAMNHQLCRETNKSCKTILGTNQYGISPCLGSLFLLVLVGDDMTSINQPMRTTNICFNSIN